MNYEIEELHSERLSATTTHPAIVFVPENLNEASNATEFIYPEATTDIRKVFTANYLQVEYLSSEKPLLRARKYADWFGPAIFFSSALIAQNPTIVGISLNLISSYLYDFFKGSVTPTNASFELIIEDKKTKRLKKIKYKGPIEGIKELETIIKSLSDSDNKP